MNEACLQEVGHGHAHNVAAAQHDGALAADGYTAAFQQLQASLAAPSNRGSVAKHPQHIAARSTCPQKGPFRQKFDASIVNATAMTAAPGAPKETTHICRPRIVKPLLDTVWFSHWDDALFEARKGAPQNKACKFKVQNQQLPSACRR